MYGTALSATALGLLGSWFQALLIVVAYHEAVEHYKRYL